MFTKSIADPAGKEWIVSIRLLPARQGIGPRERFIGRLSKKRKNPTRGSEKKSSWSDFFDVITPPLPDSVDDIRLLLIFVIVAIVFTLIGWPLLLVLADLIWLLLVLMGALLSFVVFRRPITVSATSRRESYYWKIHGLAKARQRKREIVLAISRGESVANYTLSPSNKPHPLRPPG